MQNIAILCALMTGATAAASSDVQPMTSARFEVEANIWLTAGTASAGSPRVSTLLQVSGRGGGAAGGGAARAARRGAARGQRGERPGGDRRGENQGAASAPGREASE